MRFSQFSGFRVKRSLGGQPMSSTLKVAVGAAAATQRARVSFQRDFGFLNTALKSRGLLDDTSAPQDINDVARGGGIRNQKVPITLG